MSIFGHLVRRPSRTFSYVAGAVVAVLVLGGGAAAAATIGHGHHHSTASADARARSSAHPSDPRTSHQYGGGGGSAASSSAATSASSSPSTSTPATTAAAPSTTKVAAPVGPASHASPPKTTSAAGGGGAPPVSAPTGGKPGAGNTGVPAGTALTVVNGDQTYRTSGQVISGLDIHGIVTIIANNVTIKNSIIRGPDSSPGCSNTALIVVGSGTGTVVQDSEIAPSAATACMDGLWVNHATLLRLNVHGVVDGVKAADNTTVQDSYFHDLHVFSSDPNQGGGPTHNDGVQTFEANSFVTLNHNFFNLSSAVNSDYQLTQDGGQAARNIVIENNWLYGGGCSLNLSSKGAGAVTAANGVSVVNNRFGQGSSAFNCPMLLSNTFALASFSGNVWDASGAAMTAYAQHD